MEQAVTGNAPPPMGIQGGGHVLLNMRGNIGATVVGNPPGSAQAAAVVGSPGPPGTAGRGQQRMVITQQMLAQAARPGQPAELSDDDTDSVLNQCDENISDNDDNRELVTKTNAAPERPRSLSPPASNTGVSISSPSDLLQQQHGDDACGGDDDNIHEDKCQEIDEELLKDDSLDREIDFVKAASSMRNRVEGNVRCNNDLSLSSPSVEGSPNPVNFERSVSQSPCAPHPDSQQTTFSSSPSTLPTPITPPPNVSPPIPPGDGDDEDSGAETQLEHELMDCDDDIGTSKLRSCANDNSGTSKVENNFSFKGVLEENVNNSEPVGSLVSSDKINTSYNNNNSRKRKRTDSNNSDDDNEYSETVVEKGAQESEREDNSQQYNCEELDTNVPVSTESVYTTTTAIGAEETSPATETQSDNSGALQSGDANSSHDNSSSNNVNYKDSSPANQLCVQNDKCATRSVIISPVESETCDNAEEGGNSSDYGNQQAFVTVTSGTGEENSETTESSVIVKCLENTGRIEPAKDRCPSEDAEEEPPPLVRDESATEEEDMGNRASRRRPNVEIEEEDGDQLDEAEEATVDDVNLDMFADAVAADNDAAQGQSNGAVIQHVGRPQSSTSEGIPEDPRPVHQIGMRRSSSQGNLSRDQEAGQDNRPKLVDLNIADFIFMNDEIEEIEDRPPSSQAIAPAPLPNTGTGSQSFWSNSQSSSSRSVEHPYSPPKIINEIFSSPPSSCRMNSITTLGVSADSYESTWNNKGKVTSVEMQNRLQQQQSPPSCAFQFSSQLPNNNNMHGTSRISSGGYAQQQNTYSTLRTPPQQSMYAHSNSTATATTPPNNFSNFQSSSTRANLSNSNLSSEYKSHSQQQSYLHQLQSQQQRCFTTDPQLQAQYLQYAQHYPLGQQDNKDPNKMSTSSTTAAASIARGQYPHAITHPPHQQQDHVHSNKMNPIRPSGAAIVQQHQQQQQHNQMNAMRQQTGMPHQSHLQQQQHRQYSPVVPQQHFNSPFQSQYRSNVITNANGCDNTNSGSSSSSKSGYNTMQQQQINYMGPGQGHPPAAVGGSRPGAHSYSGHASQYPSTSSTIAQNQSLVRQQQYPSSAMPKELPSCSFGNVPGATRIPQQTPGGYSNPSQMSHPNYSGSSAAAAAAQQHSSSYSGTSYGSYSSAGATGGHASRMPYPQQSHGYPSQVPSSKAPPNVTPPAGWNLPLLRGARAQLLQVLRPEAFANQNLQGRGVDPSSISQSSQQIASRIPYSTASQQYLHQRQQAAYQSSGVPMAQQQQGQQRTSSVIAPRYSANPQHQQHHGMPGGSIENLPKQPSALSTSTSPQMLRNPQFIAHQSLRPGGVDSSGSSGAYNQSSVIRPNVYTSSTQHQSPGSATINSSNVSMSSSNNGRPLYGSSSSSSSTSSNLVAGPINKNSTYYNNQASVIRAPPISTSNSASACVINRNSASSCIVIERTGHHHPGSAVAPSSSASSSTSTSGGGYNTGELTLQNFLSHPNAPYICPSPSSASTPNTSSATNSPMGAERSASSSGGSGYHYSSSEHWGGSGTFHLAHGAGDHEDEDESMASLSSCQYGADGAMRSYNAPITLQALSGLPGIPGMPGNHLLVKTENGQFQLVSVRMQSPTAAVAAPGTPVPSTVAAPPTSMPIAQQLPSNSSLAPPLPQPPPPHAAPPPGGPPSALVPPPTSLITTTTIPHPSAQQGRIITSSSSNHNITSWSSSNNNSLVNNNSTSSSPLPVITSTGTHPTPHIGPSPPIHAPSVPNAPSSVPSSVIMPPPNPPPPPASNSQLLSTANSISSSSTSSSAANSSAAAAAVASVIDIYREQMAASSAQQQQQHGSVMGPPGGARQASNSISTNCLPPGATVIRAGSGVSLPPPPPPIVVSSSSNAAAQAAVAAVANSVISSSTNPSNSTGSTSPGTFRPPLPPPPSPVAAASAIPNNNSLGGSMGMMTASPPNSVMSVPHPNHPLQHSHHLQISSPNPPYNSQLHPPQQAYNHASSSSYTSNSIASANATANTVSQMTTETAKTKCKNFLSFLLELSAKQNQNVARNVKNLIQGLIDGKVNEENFADRLQKEVNSQPQPCLVGFLKKSLPHLRHSLAVKDLTIEGIKPPPLATLVPQAPVTGLVAQTPPTPPEPTSRKKPSKQAQSVRPTTPTVPASPVRVLSAPVNSASPSSTPPTSSVSASSSGAPTPPTTSPSPSSTKTSKPKSSSSKSKSGSSSNSSSAGGASASSGPGGTPGSKSSIPSTSKSSKEKEKKDKQFASSGYGADDDINDVAAMGGVNLAEESQRILGSTEYVGTQIRSCRDETFIPVTPIAGKFKSIAAKYGLEEVPSTDVAALLSHAVEERLKTMVEKLSVIAEHRMDVIKLDERYEITQDVKGQLRFLEELDKLEKKRHDEQEREMLIKAAKSRSKSEDPEQAKLKAKAKEMQRVALEEMRQRDANLTALQAIGPRKKPKLDIAGGSHGLAVPSSLGTSGASTSLGRPQMPLRPRLKRVNLRDLLFLLEHDKETMKSPFLYKNLLLK